MTKNSVPWGEVRAWLLSDPEVRRAYDALEAFRQGLLRHVEVLDGLLGDTAP